MNSLASYTNRYESQTEVDGSNSSRSLSPGKALLRCSIAYVQAGVSRRDVPHVVESAAAFATPFDGRRGPAINTHALKQLLGSRSRTTPALSFAEMS
ncbi:MAG: hypothetical protein ABW166_01455 [Sedimenticola sp.]